MSARGFFAARAFAPQIRQNHGLGNIAPLIAPTVHRFGKISLVLAAAQPTIVLPDFAPKLPR